MIDLEEQKLIGIHWVALYVNDDSGNALTMQPILTAMEMNYSKRNLTNSQETKIS